MYSYCREWMKLSRHRSIQQLPYSSLNECYSLCEAQNSFEKNQIPRSVCMMTLRISVLCWMASRTVMPITFFGACQPHTNIMFQETLWLKLFLASRVLCECDHIIQSIFYFLSSADRIDRNLRCWHLGHWPIAYKAFATKRKTPVRCLLLDSCNLSISTDECLSWCMFIRAAVIMLNVDPFVCWDADLRRSDSGSDSWKVSGSKWNRDKALDTTKNSYLVLLTCARKGMAIFVPCGGTEGVDNTRNCEWYDRIENYLLGCGARKLECKTAKSE